MGQASTSSMEAPNPEVKALGALNQEQSSLPDVKPGCENSACRAREESGRHQKVQDLATGPSQPNLYQTPLVLYGSRPTLLDRSSGKDSSSKLSNLNNASPSNPSRDPLHEDDASIYLRKDPLQPLPVPIPDAGYLSLASIPPISLPTPQQLLLVLDLNGTLLYRPHGASNYHPRPFLPEFLAYCLANHSLLVWSSATPPNVSAICARLFQPRDRNSLLGEWARDTLGLTSEQYASRVQVYKRLDRIWDNADFSSTHPLSYKGSKWSQANTLLIDDSAMKASAQPYNLVQISEFVKGGAENRGAKDVLGQVVGYLEEARSWGNVSAFVRGRRFEVDCGWEWNWKETKSMRKKKIIMSHVEEESLSDDAEEDGEGMKING